MAAAKLARAEQNLADGAMQRVKEDTDPEGRGSPTRGETTTRSENGPRRGREGEEGRREQSVS